MIRNQVERSIMVLGYLLNMPFAMVMVGRGAANYQEYNNAARLGRFIFGFQFPDDSLVDSKTRPPVRLDMPTSGELHQMRGIAVSGSGIDQAPLLTYGWGGLGAVDRWVSAFASSVHLFESDMSQLMRRTAELKAVGGEAVVAVREAACEWVRGHEVRWREWIPISCLPGTYPGTVDGIARSAFAFWCVMFTPMKAFSIRGRNSWVENSSFTLSAPF
jgi:hypothetical protein